MNTSLVPVDLYKLKNYLFEEFEIDFDIEDIDFRNNFIERTLYEGYTFKKVLKGKNKNNLKIKKITKLPNKENYKNNGRRKSNCSIGSSSDTKSIIEDIKLEEHDDEIDINIKNHLNDENKNIIENDNSLISKINDININNQCKEDILENKNLDFNNYKISVSNILNKKNNINIDINRHSEKMEIKNINEYIFNEYFEDDNFKQILDIDEIITDYNLSICKKDIISNKLKNNNCEFCKKLKIKYLESINKNKEISKVHISIRRFFAFVFESFKIISNDIIPNPIYKVIGYKFSEILNEQIKFDMLSINEYLYSSDIIEKENYMYNYSQIMKYE